MLLCVCVSVYLRHNCSPNLHHLFHRGVEERQRERETEGERERERERERATERDVEGNV